MCVCVCVCIVGVCAFVVFFSLPLDYVCGGELFTHLHQVGPFMEEQARVYAAEVTLALEHLHSVSYQQQQQQQQQQQKKSYLSYIVMRE